MFKKLKNRKVIIIVSIIILLMISINTILSYLVKQRLDAFLLKNNTEYYTTTVDNLAINLFSGAIRLDNLSLSPSSNFYEALKTGTAQENELVKIQVASLKMKNVGLIKLLSSKSVRINQLIIDNLSIQEYENKAVIKKEIKKQTSINLDSLLIEKLNGLIIKKIKFNNLHYQQIDISDDEVTFHNNPISFKINGFELEKFDKHLFRLKPLDKTIEINDIKLNFEESHYHFSVNKIRIDYENRLINIKNLEFKPTQDKVILANSYKYNTEVHELQIKDLFVYNFDLLKALNQQGVFIDSIKLQGVHHSIYKDKRKPFDENKRPQLPHIALKKMELPFYIQNVKIDSSRFNLEEKLEQTDLSMKIWFDDIQGQISNITSIKEFRNIPMDVHLEAKFMGEANLIANARFPLKDYEDTFYFSGSLGKASLFLFDQAIFPVLGLKVLKGDLDRLTFSASANNVSSQGKMTMLYHDLEAEVFKLNYTDENHFLSWTVNHVLRESNPGKNKKIRAVSMQYNKSTYKGFGNYYWKTLQSGIVNTIAPFGFKTEKKKKEKKKK